MKFCLKSTALFCLFSLSAIAQKPLKTVPRSVYSSVEDMARTEGYPNGAYLIGTITATGTLTEYTKLLNGIAGSATYSTLTTFPSAPITAGRAWLTLGGNIGTNREVTGSYTSGIPLSTLYPAWPTGGISWGAVAGGSGVVMGGAIYSLRAQPINATVKTITLPVRDTLTRTIGSTTPISIGYHYSVAAIDFTDDDNYTAPFVLEWFGDSKAFGTGTGEAITQIAFLSRNYFRELGYDIRLRNNSVSGVTVGQQLYAVQKGYYTFPMKSSLIFVDLGTNDFTQHADSVANRTVRLVRSLLKINPVAKIVVLALLPRDDVSGRDALMATISTATASAIATVGSPRVYYCTNTRTAFTATDATMYIADKLHPSEIGNANWWTALRTFLNATPDVRALITPVN